jgi:hypothetical protein
MTCGPRAQPDDSGAMFRAPEAVRERLLRATQALQDAGIYYAIIGANAVAFWVGAKDEGAIRNTPNADVMVDPTSLVEARRALESVGFVQPEPNARPVSFLDGPTGKCAKRFEFGFRGILSRRTRSRFPRWFTHFPLGRAGLSRYPRSCG